MVSRIIRFAVAIGLVVTTSFAWAQSPCAWVEWKIVNSATENNVMLALAAFPTKAECVTHSATWEGGTLSGTLKVFLQSSGDPYIYRVYNKKSGKYLETVVYACLPVGVPPDGIYSK